MSNRCDERNEGEIRRDVVTASSSRRAFLASGAAALTVAPFLRGTILYAGVCHSDIHTARGDWGPIDYTLVPGHEIVGREAGVSKPDLGDKQ